MTRQLVKPSLREVIEPIPTGAHICQIFYNDEERNETLLKFLLSGLRIGDCAACFSQKANEREINTLLNSNGLSYGELLSSGAFTLSDSGEVYLKDNIFDPDRMLDLLGEYFEESKELGFSGVWVITEMTPEIREVSGGNRLLEYEYRLCTLLEQHPLITLCQYDARCFDENTIMDILKLHPFMVSQGAVVRNPLFCDISEQV